MLVLTLLLAASLAQDLDPATGRPIVYERETILDFDDLPIDGTIVKPEGAVFLEPTAMRFAPLIRFRDGFAREVRTSADEVE